MSEQTSEELLKEALGLIVQNGELTRQIRVMSEARRKAELRQDGIVMSRNSWRARALAAEQLIKDVIKTVAGVAKR